ncbi:MAG: hypothetical protein IJ661_06610 [Lachnospiraceae bacterium]|nr:hypothetical protein [Lachnospiraceae bacterium]
MDRRLAARILIIILVFTGTIFVVNKMSNAGVSEVTAEMEQSAIPVMYVRYNEQFINMLHGYTGKVDTTYFRDTITPMDYGQNIEIWVSRSEGVFTGYEYELRSQYQGDLIENDTVTEVKSEEGYDKLSITFRSKLEELSEYVIVIKALTDKEDVAVRYYTRAVVENNFHAAKLLEFVERFNNAIFDKQQAENVISKSIEPNEEGNNDYLTHVNIHSSFETITFAELKPSRITKPVAAIKEIDDSYAIIQLKYLISATENKIPENFFVTEDYRVRYVDEQNVYLLDYNRSQEEVFTTDNINTTSNSFKLGIIDQRDFQCVTSSDQHKAAFVQTRQLWYYDYDAGLVSNVFGFCQSTNYTDPRASYDDNNIKILKMDNSGNISFAVYGYMNSGKYEGKVGIAVYRYIADKSRVDELLFIENDKPYNILREDMETLMYLNKEDEFFYFDHDCIMRIDTKEMKSEIFIEDVLNENLAVSTDDHLIGYPNALHIEDTTMVTVLDLDTGESRDIQASSAERFRAIGFVQQDLVLGRIKEPDIVVAMDKTVICPISSIDLMDSRNKVVKTYESSGMYVINARAEDEVIYLERVKRFGDEFEEAPADFITYKEDEDPNKVSVSYKYEDDAYNQLYLKFPDYMYIVEMPKLIITKEGVSDADVTVKISFDHVNPKYYAFGQGHFMTDYLNLNEAVRAAYENAGVVTDDDGIILWRKIAVKDYHTVADKIRLFHVDSIEDSLAACIYMMGIYEEKNPDYSAMKDELSGGTPVEDVILKYVGRQGTDITGCDFENGLYYLCKDAPVITRFSDGTYVLVTSYNGQRVRYINPLEDTDTVDEREEFEENIMQSGNVFISYVR